MINGKKERLFAGERKESKSRARAARVGVATGKEGVGAIRPLTAGLCCTGLKYGLKPRCFLDRMNIEKH